MTPGSELFEQITVLPEYYPTRTELSILRERGGEIAKLIPQGAALVEFSAGATTKGVRCSNTAVSRPTFRSIFPAISQAQAEGLRSDFPTLAVIRLLPTSPRRLRCRMPSPRRSFFDRRSAISSRRRRRPSCAARKTLGTARR
jgi:uncharacterized SAM-dependent methyltransferase